MHRTLYILAALALLSAYSAASQTDGLPQIDDALHEYLERQRTLGRLPNAHLTHKPLSAYEARRYIEAETTDTTTDYRRG